MPSIVPNGDDRTYYLVVNAYGKLGIAFVETDVSRRPISKAPSTI
jgi:hypothetical protein